MRGTRDQLARADKMQKHNASSGETTDMLKLRTSDCLTRLKRIEGQVRGVSRMIDEQRYCIDILTQLSAIKAALNKVETEILKDHAAHCVADAIQSGDPAKQKAKFNELVELFGRYK